MLTNLIQKITFHKKYICKPQHLGGPNKWVIPTCYVDTYFLISVEPIFSTLLSVEDLYYIATEHQRGSLKATQGDLGSSFAKNKSAITQIPHRLEGNNCRQRRQVRICEKIHRPFDAYQLNVRGNFFTAVTVHFEIVLFF